MSETLFGILGILLGAWLGHRFDLGRSRLLKRESDIKAEQVTFLPMIEESRQKLTSGQPLSNWRKLKPNINDAARRFRLFLLPRRQKTFDLIWQELATLKDSDLLNVKGTWFGPEEEKELVATQMKLIDKLGRLYESVERC